MGLLQIGQTLSHYRMSRYSNAFEHAAQALTDLATRFPRNATDAWWRLGELYERKLKDLGKAREA